MQKILWCILAVFLMQRGMAQVSEADLPQMKTYEDSLRILGDSTLNGEQQVIRQEAAWTFIRTLKKALLIDGSFEYPFDSLRFTSIQYPEDRSFRIFTWRVQLVDGSFRFYGCIQKKKRKKNEPLFWPLYDYGHFMKQPLDTITDNERWFGTLYYKVMKHGKYYMLYGFDQNNPRSNKKVVDILTFDKSGHPVFGAPVFNMVNDQQEPVVHCRYIIEYKKDAHVSINYDPDYDMIIWDHLVPENPIGKGYYYTYIPDGTYEGFKPKGGKWYYVSSTFNSKNTPDDINQKPIDFDSQNKNFYKPKPPKKNN